MLFDDGDDVGRVEGLQRRGVLEGLQGVEFGTGLPG